VALIGGFVSPVLLNVCHEPGQFISITIIMGLSAFYLAGEISF